MRFVYSISLLNTILNLQIYCNISHRIFSQRETFAPALLQKERFATFQCRKIFMKIFLNERLNKFNSTSHFPYNIENIHSVLLLQNFYFYSKIVDTGAGYAIGAGMVIKSLGKVGITSLCFVVGDLTRLRSVVHSVSSSPLFGITYRLAFIDLPKFSYIICQRIIGIRRAQKRLYRQQNCSDLKCWTPLVFENIKTNPA